MIEQIDIFLELQEIDDNIDAAEEKKRSVPLKMEKIKREVFNTKKQLDAKNETYKSLKVKMKRVELDLKEKSDKIDKHQEDLFAGKVSDIKELKQLQKAIEKYKEEKDKIEEDLLVLMEESEIFQKAINVLEEELKNREEKFDKLKEETDNNLAQSEKEAKQLIDRRKRIVKVINDIHFLKQYELLRKDKGGDVILLVNTSICPGCYLDLPSDVVYHLKKDQSIVVCPNCSRILIWRE